MDQPDARPDADYLVVVQCHITKERCSGYFCERAFRERTGGFADLPADRPVRMIFMTCGGCCGKRLHRTLGRLLRNLERHEGMERRRVRVQLASCVTLDNYHAPRCPFVDYLKALVGRLGLEAREDSHVVAKAAERRAAGIYGPGPGARDGESG